MPPAMLSSASCRRKSRDSEGHVSRSWRRHGGLRPRCRCCPSHDDDLKPVEAPPASVTVSRDAPPWGRDPGVPGRGGRRETSRRQGRGSSHRINQPGNPAKTLGVWRTRYLHTALDNAHPTSGSLSRTTRRRSARRTAWRPAERLGLNVRPQPHPESRQSGSSRTDGA